MKWIWRQNGLEDRGSVLPVPRERTERYQNLRYTVVHYQFLIHEHKMKLVSISDYDASDHRGGFFEGSEWQEIGKDSPDDVVRSAVLKWVDDHWATNWTYIGKGDNPKILGNYEAYVDKDTVVSNGNKVSYWELQIYNDDADGVINEKSLHKIEAVTSSPRQWRQLEAYLYDAADRETVHDTEPWSFSPVRLPIYDKEIDFALNHAKAGGDNARKPTLP